MIFLNAVNGIILAYKTLSWDRSIVFAKSQISSQNLWKNYPNLERAHCSNHLHSLLGLLRYRILQTSDSLYEVKTVVLRKGILGENARERVLGTLPSGDFMMLKKSTKERNLRILQKAKVNPESRPSQ